MKLSGTRPSNGGRVTGEPPPPHYKLATGREPYVFMANDMVVDATRQAAKNLTPMF